MGPDFFVSSETEYSPWLPATQERRLCSQGRGGFNTIMTKVPFNNRWLYLPLKIYI